MVRAEAWGQRGRRDMTRWEESGRVLTSLLVDELPGQWWKQTWKW